ncbi:diatom spindle kinesin 1 [Powellomyces hirtus]|nr:diatom spindle kinesin 1 [Powellomyces hirtus]
MTATEMTISQPDLAEKEERQQSVAGDAGPNSIPASVTATALCKEKHAAWSTLNSTLRAKEGSAAERLLGQKAQMSSFIYEAGLKLLRPEPLPEALSDEILLAATKDDGRDTTVCIRVRPVLPHEEAKGEYPVVIANNPGLNVHSMDFRWNGMSNIKTNKYEVDLAFGPEHDNDVVYNAVAKPLIPLVLSNGMGTLLAYGQTGSGKTYTMTSMQERIATDIFSLARQHRHARDPAYNGSDDTGFVFTLCFFELMGKQAFDLLDGRKSISILEDTFGAVQIVGARQEDVLDSTHFLELIERGSALRRTEATAKNETSSRSHAVCCIKVRNKELPEAEDGMLYLVDLAGSENNSDSSHHNRDRISETKEINKSLGTLKECIRNRSLVGLSNNHVHIPFRTSQLTLILKEAFDPLSTRQCRTTVIANVSPGILDAQQTLNTMRYIEPLRVTLPPQPTAVVDDQTNPATWTNAYLRKWILANYLGGKVDPNMLCPTESGKQLCRVPMGTFINRCMLCEGVDPRHAKELYLKLWNLLIDARTRNRNAPSKPAARIDANGARKASIRPAVPRRPKQLAVKQLKPGQFVALTPDAISDGKAPIVLLLEKRPDGAWVVADVVAAENDPDRYELLIADRWVAHTLLLEKLVELEYDRKSRYYILKNVV